MTGRHGLFTERNGGQLVLEWSLAGRSQAGAGRGQCLTGRQLLSIKPTNTTEETISNQDEPWAAMTMPTVRNAAKIRNGMVPNRSFMRADNNRPLFGIKPAFVSVTFLRR